MYNNLSRFSQLVVMVSFIALSSCGSKKSIVYFQDEPIAGESLSQMTNNYSIRYQPNDILTIDVSAEIAESVAAFNLPAVGYNMSNSANQQTQVLRQTYLLDSEGKIEFPVLGTLQLGGLNRLEATNLLKERISEYVKEFIVNIRLLNFTVSVLGEVNNPGTYTIQGERISLTQAIGLAGDLTIYGKRDNIFLVREIDGKKKYAKYDLTSINVVNSPVYYLAQNDVIYVEPNKSKINTSRYNPNNGIIISAISTLATIAAIFIFRN